jgi:hypothetical protein
MSTAAVLDTLPATASPHAPRPRDKREPRVCYRHFRFSEEDLLRIDRIQRGMIRAQRKPKHAITQAMAVRAAVKFLADHFAGK